MEMYQLVGVLFCVNAAFGLQCYTGQLASPPIPGLSAVTLQTCPKVATRCANTESESVIDIPGLPSQTFSMKIGQCANDMICGTYTCDMAKKEQAGITKCETKCCDTDGCNGKMLNLA